MIVFRNNKQLADLYRGISLFYPCSFDGFQDIGNGRSLPQFTCNKTGRTFYLVHDKTAKIRDIALQLADKLAELRTESVTV